MFIVIMLYLYPRLLSLVRTIPEGLFRSFIAVPCVQEPFCILCFIPQPAGPFLIEFSTKAYWYQNA